MKVLPIIVGLIVCVAAASEAAEDHSQLCDASWRAKASSADVSDEISRLVAGGQTGAICENGSTALHFVETSAQVAQLVAAGSIPNQANAEGVTPMFVAASWGRAQVIEELASLGADPNRATNRGDTPLHIAVQTLEKDAVVALLAVDAKVSKRDGSGQTPLELAERYSQPEIANLLRANLDANKPIEFGFGRLELPKGGDWTEPEFDTNIGRFAANKLIGPQHSIVAMLGVSTQFSNEIAYLLKSQPQGLLEHRVQEVREQMNNGRFPIKEFKDFTWGYKEAVCHGYEATAHDLAVKNDAGHLFEFRAMGLACVVQKYPAYLEFDYSERWDPDEDAYKNFKAEAWEYFDSLNLD